MIRCVEAKNFNLNSMKIAIPSFCWECLFETDQTNEAYEKLKKELNSDIDYE